MWITDISCWPSAECDQSSNRWRHLELLWASPAIPKSSLCFRWKSLIRCYSRWCHGIRSTGHHWVLHLDWILIRGKTGRGGGDSRKGSKLQLKALRVASWHSFFEFKEHEIRIKCYQSCMYIVQCTCITVVSIFKIWGSTSPSCCVACFWVEFFAVNTRTRLSTLTTLTPGS